MRSSSLAYDMESGSGIKNAPVSERTKFSKQPDGADHVGHGDTSVLADVVDDLNGQLGCGWGAGARGGGITRAGGEVPARWCFGTTKTRAGCRGRSGRHGQ